LLGPWAEQLQGLGLTGAQALAIELLTQAPQTADTPVWCGVRTANGRNATFTAAALPEGAAQQLRHRLRGVAGSRRLRRRLASTGAVCLASRVLSLPLLQSLAVGDVVLTPCAAQATEGWPAFITWGAVGATRLTLACRLTEQALTIEGDPRMTDDNDTGASALPDESVDSLGELDIPVRFELETVAVPLADLEAIQPGYVIELTTPLAAATIRLVAFGQTLGHAQLVAVGDKLGARITRLVTRDERQSAD
jgi:type III secretion protein Q